MNEEQKKLEDLCAALLRFSSIRNNALHKHFCLFVEKSSSPTLNYSNYYSPYYCHIKTASSCTYTILNYFLNKFLGSKPPLNCMVNPCLLRYYEAFEHFATKFQYIWVFHDGKASCADKEDKNRTIILQSNEIIFNDIAQLLNAFLVYLFQALKSSADHLQSKKSLASIIYRNDIIRKHLNYYRKNSDDILFADIVIEIQKNDKNDLDLLEDLLRVQKKVLRDLRNHIKNKRINKQFRYIWKIKRGVNYPFFKLVILSKPEENENEFVSGWLNQYQSEIVKIFEKLNIKIRLSWRDSIISKSAVLENLLYPSSFYFVSLYSQSSSKKKFGVGVIGRDKQQTEESTVPSLNLNNKGVQ